MSIHDEIGKHIAEHRLFFVGPALHGDEVARHMFVGEEIKPLLDPAALSSVEDGYRLGHVRPQLDIYTSGGRLNVALDPFDKDKSAHLARTNPVTDEIWDVRCTDPDARIRVFGRFLEFDLFVALTWQYRENLKTPLDWTNEQERFKDKWRVLFPYQALYAPTKADGYVSQPFKLV